jgi:hypothetical protein
MPIRLASHGRRKHRLRGSLVQPCAVHHPMGTLHSMYNGSATSLPTQSSTQLSQIYHHRGWPRFVTHCPLYCTFSPPLPHHPAKSIRAIMKVAPRLRGITVHTMAALCDAQRRWAGPGGACCTYIHRQARAACPAVEGNDEINYSRRTRAGALQQLMADAPVGRPICWETRRRRWCWFRVSRGGGAGSD